MDANPGKLLIVVGLLIAGLGVLVVAGGKMGLGRLPGDVIVRGERTTVYFPIVTCLVLSVGLSLIIWLVQRLGGR